MSMSSSSTTSSTEVEGEVEEELVTNVVVGGNLSDAQLYSFIGIVCVSSFLSIMGSTRVLLLQRDRDAVVTVTTTGQQQDPQQGSNSSGGGRNTTNNSRSSSASQLQQRTTRQQKRRRRTYHRLVTGLSVGDIIFSITNFLQPFLADADRTVIPSAFGNQMTCSFLAFVFIWSNLVCTMYNAILSLHFWLVVVRRWRNEDLEAYFERPMQVIAWIWPLVLPCFALVSGANEQGQISMMCLNAREPPLIPMLYFGTSGISVLTAILCTVWVYVFYRRQVVYTRRRSSYSNSFTTESQSNRVQTLARRSVAYTFVYINTILWPLLSNVLAGVGDTSKGLVYGLRLLGWIFFPLQGFFNLMIYIQPLIQQGHKANPNVSKLHIFTQIVIKGDVSISQRPPQLGGASSTRLDRGGDTSSSLQKKSNVDSTNNNIESIMEEPPPADCGLVEEENATTEAAVLDNADGEEKT